MAIDEDKRSTLRRFAAIGAASPLAAVSGLDEEDSEVREAIQGYLTTTPGAHFSKLRDDLKLGTGETQYHLRRLSENGVLEVTRDGDYKRFFPAGRFDNFEKVALGYLRRETPRGMLVTLLQEPDLTGSELATRVGVSQASVSTYASQLEDAGLLRRTDGFEVRRPEILVTLVLRYADSFDEAAIAFAADAASLLRYEP